jgi:hypothetical protein
MSHPCSAAARCIQDTLRPREVQAMPVNTLA